MEEKKRPWWQLFDAAVWGLAMYLRLKMYLGLANEQDKVPVEAWQKLETLENSV